MSMIIFRQIEIQLFSTKQIRCFCTGRQIVLELRLNSNGFPGEGIPMLSPGLCALVKPNIKYFTFILFYFVCFLTNKTKCSKIIIYLY